MKKLVIISVFIFPFKIAIAQDSLSCEMGSTLVTLNSFNTRYYYAPDRPAIEFINGLFFRYNKNRLGLRVHASYSESFSIYTSNPNQSDTSSGDINNKDIRLGVGGQFSILKRKDWFYAFVDLSYRNVFSYGHSYGGNSNSNDQFTRTANGIDFLFGLGFKMKILRAIYLSPELGYNVSNKIVASSSTPMITGQTIESNYTETNINYLMKLQLTAKF